ncbi:Fic family protein [Corynebacterium sp. NML120713]|uniref:Fic family protein n=1 Tax=Corynebacterium sp. NML120713 TaxID=1906332 RepID=UPI0008FB3092|nr:Fic family protein [Corynebacterium sp. NML120713]OIR44516.1 hypothetical protein BJP06_02550 [Corynebacterium sp. NML120713]
MLRTDAFVSVIYSAGKVFDNLRTGRLATEAFLANGSTAGIASRADLQLLQDLQDVAKIALRAKHDRQPVTAELVCALNAAMTRSAALHPGQLRREEQRIGVRTAQGDHMPPALTMEKLRALVEEDETEPFAPDSMLARAALLFVRLAKAQPFEDGNKRTAILAANALLPEDAVLVVPHDAQASGEIESEFHDLLGRAYIYGDDDRSAVQAVVEFMLAHQPAGK